MFYEKFIKFTKFLYIFFNINYQYRLKAYKKIMKSFYSFEDQKIDDKYEFYMLKL